MNFSNYLQLILIAQSLGQLTHLREARHGAVQEGFLPIGVGQKHGSESIGSFVFEELVDFKHDSKDLEQQESDLFVELVLFKVKEHVLLHI